MRTVTHSSMRTKVSIENGSTKKVNSEKNWNFSRSFFLKTDKFNRVFFSSIFGQSDNKCTNLTHSNKFGVEIFT